MLAVSQFLGATLLQSEGRVNASVREWRAIKIERHNSEQMPSLVLEENYLTAAIFKCFKEILENHTMYLNEVTLLNGRWEMARKACSHVTGRETVRGLVSSLLHSHWVTERWHTYGSGREPASVEAAILVPTPFSTPVSKGCLLAAPLLNNPPSVCLLKRDKGVDVNWYNQWRKQGGVYTNNVNAFN